MDLWQSVVSPIQRVGLWAVAKTWQDASSVDSALSHESMLCLLQSPSRRRSGAAQIDRVRATTWSLSIRQSLAMVLPRYPTVVSILSAVTFSRINNLSRAVLPTYQPPHVRYRQRYWVNFTCWYYFVKWDAAIQYWLSDTRDQVWSRFTHRFEWHPNAENNQHQLHCSLQFSSMFGYLFRAIQFS